MYDETYRYKFILLLLSWIYHILPGLNEAYTVAFECEKFRKVNIRLFEIYNSMTIIWNILQRWFKFNYESPQHPKDMILADVSRRY